jgi:uncharacterized RDD family membrane protein YckC
MKNLNLPKEATFKGPAILWKRMFAFLIDLFIIDLVAGFSLRSLLTGLIPETSFIESFNYLASNSQLTSTISLITFFFGFIALLYFALLEYKLGQSIGKMLMNIKVESDTDSLTFFACMIRSMFLIMITPLIFLWIIDPFFMFFTKDKRRLSEILSKTRTISVYALR